MNKTVVVKLDVVVDIFGATIAAAGTQEPIPDVLSDLNKCTKDVFNEFGFERSELSDDEPSRRNGGWAFYNIYILVLDNLTVKFLVDVRTADHSSKPALADKNKKRKEADERDVTPQLKKQYPGSSHIESELMDIYYKKYDGGVQYFIGKGDTYSNPIKSLDRLKSILAAQIKKLIEKYN